MMPRIAIALCAIGAGLSWLLWEALRLAWDGSTGSDCASGAEYTGDAVFAAAGLLMGLTLLALSAQLVGIQRSLALVAAGGATLFGVANGVEHCAFEPLFLLYALGGLAFVISTAVLGFTVLVTGAVGRWPGVLLLVAALAPMMLSFDRGGAALGGAAWLMLGVALLVGARMPDLRHDVADEALTS